jgi:hypothetical protein
MPSSSNPESKARIHTHTCTQAQKQTKTKKRRSTRLAPLPQFCAEGRAGYFGSKRLQLKVAANKKETTKIKREKTERASTCSDVTHHPGWPRVTWYGMPSHLVPLANPGGSPSAPAFWKKISERTERARGTQKKTTNHEQASSNTSHKNSL